MKSFGKEKITELTKRNNIHMKQFHTSASRSKNSVVMNWLEGCRVQFLRIFLIKTSKWNCRKYSCHHKSSYCWFNFEFYSILRTGFFFFDWQQRKVNRLLKAANTWNGNNRKLESDTMLHCPFPFPQSLDPHGLWVSLLFIFYCLCPSFYLFISSTPNDPRPNPSNYPSTTSWPNTVT